MSGKCCCDERRDQIKDCEDDAVYELDEKPRTRKSSGEAEEVDQSENEVDQGGQEGSERNKLDPAASIPALDDAADERYDTQHNFRDLNNSGN